jgi:acetolactate synthase-1/2/3 large subunit
LAEHVKHIFCISGGASLHLIHSIAKQEGLNYVCPQNEQAAGFQADAYARLAGFGCALATSGPGATNLITPIATSYYDSIPVLYITGQQTRDRLSGDSGVRQLGFQETPICDIVRPITKYAKTVMLESDVEWELRKAIRIAKERRPGPVLIDIPDDLQRARSVLPPVIDAPEPYYESDAPVDDILGELIRAKRPLFIFGSAVGDVENAKRIMFNLGIPCVTTWGALDRFADYPLCFGGFGTHGVRYANFAVQNADYIVTVGTRLDTKATGSPASAFAPKAKLVMVDIDQAELGKMQRIGRPLYRAVRSDAREFLSSLSVAASTYSSYNDAFDGPNWEQALSSDWVQQCVAWREKYGAVLPAYASERLNPYTFVSKLGEWLRPDDVIVSDTGCALGWMMQAFKFTGQKFIHAWNNTPMGYGLPAAVGACFAHPDRRVILITGDGGLAVNITEFATVARHALNLKIILFNNRGHAMCRQTQRTWLGGEYPSTSHDGGLATPDYWAIASAYGIPSILAKTMEQAESAFMAQLLSPRATFLDLQIDPDYQIVPQVRAGKLLHDADPALPREEIERIMA